MPKQAAVSTWMIKQKIKVNIYAHPRPLCELRQIIVSLSICVSLCVCVCVAHNLNISSACFHLLTRIRSLIEAMTLAFTATYIQIQAKLSIVHNPMKYVANAIILL